MNFLQNLSSIEKSILATLIYFDILKRPLKKVEILDNLQRIGNLRPDENFSQKFQSAILNLLSRNLIGTKEGFYFLKKRDFLIKLRQKREKISKKFWKKLKKISKKINWIPFVKGVFVSGSLALGNANQNSDIDLLVITKPGRIFTVRAFLTFLLNLFGWRRKKEKKAGKICINQYQTLDSLEFKFQSLFVAYQFFHLIPIIERDNLFLKFKKENSWIKNYLCFFEKNFPSPFLIKEKSKISNFFERVLEGKFGNWLEKKLKEIQIRRFKRKYPFGVKKGRVILSDNLIEDHPNSIEKEIIKKYEEKTKSLISEILGAKKEASLRSKPT